MNPVIVKPKPLLILRGCPRCTGDLSREDSTYICVQCGYIEYDEPPLMWTKARTK